MTTLLESRLVGSFNGYVPGARYVLDDGSCFEQVSRTEEFVYRERPRVKILSDGNRTYADIDGTNSVVEVRRYRGSRWTGPGAF